MVPSPILVIIQNVTKQDDGNNKTLARNITCKQILKENIAGLLLRI